ncbi:DUF6338 family protein [Glutamicibacter sp. AOP12-B1-11]|uniref:DUF6338 family protein n=1 Tax=Glutamicibacter sp. AOP12-B1-11 TaxID=3457725 RepID=UPI004033F223
MPTTLASVLVYALLLVPGLAYVYEAERKNAKARESVFRETGTVLIVSLVMLGITMSISLVATSLVVEWDRLLARFLRDPMGLFTTYPLYVATALLVYLFVSTLFAMIAANKGLWENLRDRWTRDTDLAVESSWTHALSRDIENNKFSTTEHETLIRHSSITLKSGTRIRGPLASWNPLIEDTQDKSLILRSPIWRAQIDEEFKLLRGADKVIVHATEIEYFTIVFLDKDGKTVYPRPSEKQKHGLSSTDKPQFLAGLLAYAGAVRSKMCSQKSQSGTPK